MHIPYGAPVIAAALAALLAAAGAAQAVMPPAVYEQARDDAPYHVQVAVRSVAVADQTPGACTVSGEVVRIFRDTGGRLAVGEPVTFSVSCTRAGDRVPIGGVLWTDAARLSAARFVEAFLLGVPPDLSVALYQSRIIEAPSETPQWPRP